MAMRRWLNVLQRLWSTLSGRGNRDNKVIALSGRRKRRVDANADIIKSSNRCGRCGKPSKRLTFYVDESGRPAGFCKACEPHAKKRDLLPL